jgi:hypothetical protein
MLVTLNVVRVASAVRGATLIFEARRPATGRLLIGAQPALRGSRTQPPWPRPRTATRARWFWRRDGWGMPPELRRVVLIHAWTDESASARYRESLAAGAVERWSASLRLLRVSGTVRGERSAEDPGGALGALDSPGVVLTYADVPARLSASWMRYLAASVDEQHRRPGALASIGTMSIWPFRSHGFTISCWRRLGDALDYAYRGTDHRGTMDWYRTHGAAAATWFARCELEASYGALDGRDPFAGVVDLPPRPEQAILPASVEPRRASL